MKSVRVTLTRPQTKSPFGLSLVASLSAIAADGEIDLTEVQILHVLLAEGPQELPAVPFLRRLTTAILTDGELDGYEAYELRLAIERVLPKAEREGLAGPLSRIQAPIEEDDIDDPDPATDRQIDYIRILGGIAPPNLGKWEASALIDELKNKAGPSNRQKMVLRFWGRTDLLTQSVNQISRWMDAFYAADSRHVAAWELFKEETRDDGSQGNPDRVPLGVGPEYLRKLHDV